MKGDFFVMLFTQDGSYTPLEQADKEDIARFETEEEARTAAESSLLGDMFGYEVFNICCGI
ncbi:hypothetical protein [Methylobacter sp.]|uniref:hypothetical protein n=1 Tax=Methylobacter sp. TaxID=2051955 RepID=UPI002FDEE079